MSNPLKSSTTQNVAAGTVAGGGVGYAIVAIIRAIWPAALGDGSADLILAGVLTAILGPLLSRRLAFLRAPGKKGPSVGHNGGRSFRGAWILLVGAGLLMAGCRTVSTAPDGTRVEQVDIQATIAAVELTVSTVEALLALYEDVVATRDGSEAEAAARRAAEATARRDRLLQTLADLHALAAPVPAPTP